MDSWLVNQCLVGARAFLHLLIPSCCFSYRLSMCGCIDRDCYLVSRDESKNLEGLKLINYYKFAHSFRNRHILLCVP
jgi:hypothetical protein